MFSCLFSVFAFGWLVVGLGGGGFVGWLVGGWVGGWWLVAGWWVGGGLWARKGCGNVVFLPDAPLPDGLFRFIALDVETANRDAASISQIGLACVRSDGGIETFSTYINPDQEFADFNTELPGIEAGTVRDAPSFAQAWQRMMPLWPPHLTAQHSGFDQMAIPASRPACGLNGPK